MRLGIGVELQVSADTLPLSIWAARDESPDELAVPAVDNVLARFVSCRKIGLMSLKIGVKEPRLC